MRTRVIVAVVTLIALAGATYEGLHLRSLDRSEAARRDAKAAAQEAIVVITTLDYTRIPQDIAAGRKVMTSCFGAAYAKTVELAAPTATQVKAVITDTVDGAGVLSQSGSKAEVLVFFDQKAVFGDGRPTKVTPYRAVLQMRKVKGHWLVNFLDLGDSSVTAKGPCS